MNTLVSRSVLACLITWGPATVMADEAPQGHDLVNRAIEWTEVPKIDREDPTLQRGIVYGTEGKPLAGARIYAASNIVLFEIRQPHEVTLKDLGEVRAETDKLGRFEFHTPDLTWLPASGKRKRWEAFLVATKDGLTSGWIKTFGEDRSFRSHWNPHISKDVAIHLSEPGTVHGTLLAPNGNPLTNAHVTIKSIDTPRGRDLDKHIEKLREKTIPSSFGSGPGYQETVTRPWLIPNLKTEATTDANGHFRIDGLPKDNIVRLELTHPDIRTPTVSVAVRDMEDIIREAHEFDDEARTVLRGSGFRFQTEAGVTLRGRVTVSGLSQGQSVAGATVALANHNAADGMTGKRFKTDADGNFVITGLGPDYHDPGYRIAVVGSFQAPIQSARFTVHANQKAKLKVSRAIPYRLKLADAQGKPIDRKVYSIAVQSVPGTIRRGPTHRYDVAVKVAPGTYEGIVPNGPGAVCVERGSRRDRPVLVDPKEYFQSGRKDWTAVEARYAYGDQWYIAKPGVVTTPDLAANPNRLVSQLDLAVAILTKPGKEVPLELSATVHKDDPTQVTLVDDDGTQVVGARLRRQLKRYNEDELVGTLPLHGLHPTRAEFIEFFHEERKLIGSLRTTLTDQPVTVVMRPFATITGSIVDRDGKPTSEFGILVDGLVKPFTYLGNYVRDSGDVKKGTFALKVAPGETYSGQWMRRTHRQFDPRPLIGEAFAPVTPKPGEVIDLGNLVIP